jgi:FG-GAP-like repeat
MGGRLGGPWRVRVWLTALVALALLQFAATARAIGATPSFTFVEDPTQPSLPAGSRLLDVADLTGNGVPDLVISNAESNAVGVMLGNGSGGFAAPRWFPVAGQVWYVAYIADFNGDGHPDLLIPIETVPPAGLFEGRLPNAVEILTGDGQGDFSGSPAVLLPEPGPVYVGDFTGDGDEDVVGAPDGCVGGGNEHKFHMLLGDGHGGLAPGPTYTSPRAGGCGYIVGDFTGAGRDDLLLTDLFSAPGEEETIALLPGEGNGSFGSPILTSASNSGSFVVAVGDLNADGTTDLLVAKQSERMGEIEVFADNGDGTFSHVDSLTSEQPTTFDFAVVAGTFEADGRLDIATLGSQLAVLENEGANSFKPVLTMPLHMPDNYTYVADLTNDGRDDLILGAQSEVRVYLDEPVCPAPLLSSPTGQCPPPVIQGAHESAGELTERSRNQRSRHGVRRRIVFSYSLNEQASVRLTFIRKVLGREVAGSCVARARGSRRPRTCVRLLPVGALMMTGHAGRDELAFDGRNPGVRTLEPGHYEVTISASSTAGTAPPVSLQFDVVAEPHEHANRRQRSANPSAREPG